MKDGIKYGIVILAAGESSRLGSPKQLLPYHDKSLLANIVDASLQVPSAQTVVVTGASADQIKKEIAAKEVLTGYNENWKSGISSSIKKGLETVTEKFPSIEACIVAVCDQPYVTAALLNGLIARYRTSGKGIVASAYADTAGTPALFSNKYFDELMRLEGGDGAKKLLKKYSGDLALLPFEKGDIDIDTPQDYAQLTMES